MRNIIVSNFVSLDGFMGGSNGEIDWFVAGEEFFNYTKALLGQVDTILFGRVTYEGMARYWPNATDADPFMADKMNNTAKVVFSKTLDKVEWNNTQLVKSDIGAAVSKLKGQPGKDIVIYGSSSIVSVLSQCGLIDEYHLVVVPVVLGSGRPLFEGISQSIKLKLLRSETYKNGVVFLAYEPERK